MAEDPKTPASGESAALSAKMAQKVELDLDDAPFLEDEEPEQKPEPQPAPGSAPLAQPVPVAVPASSNKKKKIIIAGIAGVVLILIGLVVNGLFFSAKPPPPPPVVEPEKILVAPPPLPPAETTQYTMQWEPFWIEVKDSEGAVRFLSCKFSIPTNNPSLFAEMMYKQIILRDALFYYLRNQPIISLRDEARITTFKGELMTVLNEHLGSGKVNEILIEDYLIQ